MLAKILSCAISELHRLDDITPLESQALKHALSAQFKLEMLKEEELQELNIWRANHRDEDKSS
jgi:hypothetical protein